MREINAQQLKNEIDKGDCVVVDVLPEKYYKEKHVPGAINIPVDEIEERAPKEISDKNKEVIVYCANQECTASPKAAKKLEEMGYTNVKDFDAGIAGWEEAGFNFESA